MRGPGRRRGGPDTRGAILDAARSAFAEEGYDRATIRGIARSAGVDPALVHHYFGTKEHLFVTALELPVRPGEVVDAVLVGEPDGLGERLVRAFLSVWDTPPARDRLLAMIRSATSNRRAAKMIREFVIATLAGRLAERLDGARPRLRASLAGSHLMGLAMVRYVLGVEPLASADPETIVRAVAPSIQRYLTGEIDGRAAPPRAGRGRPRPSAR